MNNYSKLYWLTRLDSANAAFTLFFVIGLLMIIFYTVGCFITGLNEYEEDEIGAGKKRLVKTFGFMIPLSFSLMGFFGLLLIFVPTKNEMIVIYAGGKTMDFVQNDTSINKIPAQTTKIITDYLQDCLKEIKSK